jgi:KAP family P-loop domain/Papain family cysteine protease
MTDTTAQSASADFEMTSRRASARLFTPYKPLGGSPPDQFLPKPECIVVLDQGEEGSSVGHGMATMINYLLRERGIYEQVSVRMLQQISKQYSHLPLDQDTGSFIHDGMRAWYDHGVCPESIWPYQPQDFGTLTPERSQAAQKYRPAEIHRITKNTVETWRAAIYKYHAAVVGITIHESFLSTEVAKTGIVPMPKKNDKVSGGHAVAVLGYTPDGFLIQNSWGPGWGNLKIGDRVYPGMALLPNAYFETKGLVDDGYVASFPDTLRARPLLRRAGYQSDALESDDRLNIKPDVESVCSVLATRDVKPPLALGLFGNWGTGKSFFMARMYDEIESLMNLERENPGETPYCRNIVQIRFNAWHFLDANLWASLVAEIFNHLFEAVSDPRETPEQTRRRIIKQLGQARGLYRQSRMELEHARIEREKAQEDLKEKTEQVRAQKASLAELSDQLATLLAGDPEVQKDLKDLAEQLGVPQLNHSYEVLKAQEKELKASGGRLQRLGRVVFNPQGRRDRLILLIGLLAAPILIGALVSYLGQHGAELLSEISRIINVSTGILISAGILVAKLLRGNRIIDSLESSVDKVEKIRKERLETVIGPEKARLEQMTQAEQEAQAQADAYKQRVESLEQELAESNPDHQLQSFINERSGSEDYKKQLGLVSLIRRDFERLSELMQTSEALEAVWEKQRRAALLAGKPYNRPRPRALPIQRIILYIDDLDRCQPDRVIEVLEAVHLLLAFPLFVVVVAVDPRWLRQCLEIHYPSLLSMAKRLEEDEEGLYQPSTPQDYLEKIFQIPFYLRPINEAGYQRLLDGLTGADAAGKATETPAPVVPETPAEGDVKKVEVESPSTPVRINRSGAGGEAGLKGLQAPKLISGTPEAEEKSKKLNPEKLKFQEWELRDMQRLAPLFRTPRAVKRFVNTYRLLRVGISDADLGAFEGTANTPGSYRVAQVLLAIVAGYPNLAPRFLRRLLEKSRAKNARTATWQPFLEECIKLTALENQQPTMRSQLSKSTNVSSSSKKSKTAATGAAKKDLQNKEHEIAYYWREWDQLCETLQQLSQDGFLPQKLNAYYDFVPRVARFSFSVSMLPEYRESTSPVPK